MKRFRFSLQKVLDVRVLQEERARQAWTAAVQEREARRLQLQEAEAALEGALEGWDRLGGSAQVAAPLREAQRRYILRMLSARDAAREGLAEAEARVEGKREALVEAARARETLETLREQEAWRHRQAVEKAELGFLDETSLVRYAARRGSHG